MEGFGPIVVKYEEMQIRFKCIILNTGSQLSVHLGRVFIVQMWAEMQR